MAVQQHLDLLQQGQVVWNTWRKHHPKIRPDFSNADLNNADLDSANLNNADLSYARLSHAHLSHTRLSHARLIDTYLGDTYLDNANLSHTDLSHANLTDANLTDANLSHADLTSAYLNHANLNHTCLNHAHLSHAHLNHARLIDTYLGDTYLDNADLSHTDLFNAHLSNAHLSHTNLTSANLSYADLSGADLSGADLSLANLDSADLSSADLSGATVRGTHFVNIDLRTVRGLETVEHIGPSSVGIDTIYRSQGDIPEVFLRKAGVPEDFITYMRSLVNRPIEYYTCFISYSSRDQDFAERLYADLQSKGVRCWFAPEDMKIGDKFRQRIDESIRLYDKLLLVLSVYSVASWWVEYEVEKALAKERQVQRTVLFPIRLDEQVMQSTTDWAAHIKETRHIGDFTAWKDHDSYQRGLKRLLRDLQPDTPPEGSTPYQKPLS